MFQKKPQGSWKYRTDHITEVALALYNHSSSACVCILLQNGDKFRQTPLKTSHRSRPDSDPDHSGNSSSVKPISH